MCFGNGLLIGFQGRGSSLAKGAEGEHQPLGELRFLISLALYEAKLGREAWRETLILFAFVCTPGPDASERSAERGVVQ